MAQNTQIQLNFYNILMFQKEIADPTKGYSKQPLNLYLQDPKYEKRQHTIQQQSRIVLFETLGVFILVLGLHSYKGEIGVNIHFLLAIVMGFVMSAHGSQANFNPALSLAFTLRNTDRYQSGFLWTYIKSQVAGAFIAYVVLYMINGIIVSPIQPETYDMKNLITIILSEAAGVFVICITYLQLTGQNTSYITSRLQKFMLMSIFAWIGFHMCPSSGYASNASLTFARAVFEIFFCNFQGLKYFILWLIGDIAGVLIAVVLYNNLLEPHIVISRLKKQKNREYEKQIEETEMIALNQQK